MNKDISDVLEYLYEQGKKDLAEAVLRELKSVHQTNPPIVIHEPLIQDRTSNPKPYTWWSNV